MQQCGFAYTALFSSFTVEHSSKCLYGVDTNGDVIEKWGLKTVSVDQ